MRAGAARGFAKVSELMDCFDDTFGLLLSISVPAIVGVKVLICF